MVKKSCFQEFTKPAVFDSEIFLSNMTYIASSWSEMFGINKGKL